MAKEIKETRPQLTTAEKKAKVAADRERMLARLKEREEAIDAQEVFGGSAAISQQKIVIGAWSWKLAQTDPQVKEAVKMIISKMDQDSKVKVQKFVDVLNAKK